MVDEKIINRLKKVLALARNGVGGEKENAERQLEALMRKHNLKLSDIDDESEEKFKLELQSANQYERALFRQIISVVLDTYNPDFYHYKGSRSKFHVYVTKSQRVQIQFMCEILKKALIENLDIAYSAFVMKQQLYPATAESNNKAADLTEKDFKAMAMAAGMDKVLITTAIENHA